MVVNLIFRCSWTLTISPSVIQLIPKSTILPLVTGLIEIIRRTIWNFLRIEKEHVANANSFTVIKINPEDIIKKFKKKLHRKDSYESDFLESEIDYIKCDDGNFFEQLRSIDGYELPRTDPD
jgi:hypothetical protein